MTNAKMESLLNRERVKINKVDESILKLIHKRIESAVKIGKIKAKESAIVYRPERELEIFKRLNDLNKDSALSKNSIQAIFTEIISACRGLESDFNVAFLGPHGSFSEIAARKQFGHSVTYHTQRSIEDVFYQVEHEIVSFGVVPLENSTEGSVNATLDYLIENQLNIFCEMYLPIHHCLISKASNIKNLKKIHSHPQAIAQCRKWIVEHLPHVEIMDTPSTAEAVKKIKTSRSEAAIGSFQSSLIYNVPVLRKNIEDSKTNATRFIVLSKKKQTKKSVKDKTSLILSIPDEPGALGEILKVFSEENINLKKLESRPSKEKAFEYFFFIDIDGHIEQKKVLDCLTKIKLRANFFKHLGSYPIGRVL